MDSEYLVNRQMHRWFAENRRRTEVEIDEDFEKLLANPHLVALDFMAQDPKVLMLQTPVIDIFYEDAYWRIGSFVIFIRREFIRRSWKISYRFINTSGTLYPGNNRQSVHHPHIINEKNDELKMNMGRLCLSEGGEILDKPLREGRVPEAYPLFLEILQLYPSGYPFHEVHHWPKAQHSVTEGENNHDS